MVLFVKGDHVKGVIGEMNDGWIKKGVIPHSDYKKKSNMH